VAKIDMKGKSRQPPRHHERPNPHKKRKGQKKATVAKSEIKLGEALDRLKSDWDWDSKIPADYRFVVFHDGRRIRSDKIVSLLGAPRSHSKAKTVRDLLHDISGRLALPDQEAFTISLTTASGQFVNGHKKIETLNNQAKITNARNTIDELVERYVDNLGANFSWETWYGNSEYDFEDEDELCFVITRAWIRASLRKIGIKAFRKALKDEGW
jgi:hypothetical protein